MTNIQELIQVMEKKTKENEEKKSQTNPFRSKLEENLNRAEDSLKRIRKLSGNNLSRDVIAMLQSSSTLNNAIKMLKKDPTVEGLLKATKGNSYIKKLETAQAELKEVKKILSSYTKKMDDKELAKKDKEYQKHFDKAIKLVSEVEVGVRTSFY